MEIDKNKIEMFGQRVLVEPLVEENKSAGGIILGSQAEHVSSNLGKVLTAGPDAIAKKGDLVMYGPHSGMMVEIAPKVEILIIRQDDIQGRIKQ